MNALAAIAGTLPALIRNDESLYEGDLIHYLRVLFFKAQNLNRPYHNFRHMMHVTWLCHDACRYYVGTLTPRQMRNVLIAAMFHDFDHSGMFGHDELNIQRSILGLRKHALSEDLDHLPAIERLITATQYPHVIPNEELDLCAQILCDADVSQGLDTAWIQQVIFGLAAEWGNNPIEVLKTQEPFLSGLHFFTEWANRRFPKSSIDAKIQEANELFALITSPD